VQLDIKKVKVVQRWGEAPGWLVYTGTMAGFTPGLEAS
jgi:hypothetical protein